jgi:hypothetical protein
MCTFRKPLSKRAERFRVTRASLAGNAGKSARARRANQRIEAENFAATASIAGGNGRFEAYKTHILLDFSRWHGVC